MLYERNFYEIRSNDEILLQLKDEMSHIGYYGLPFKDTAKIKHYTSKIQQNNIYLVGIGGSSQGSKAIYNFLRNSRKFDKKLFFLDTIDPLKINYLLTLSDINDSHFVFISKSGDTIEPISILKYLDSKVDITRHNSTIITEKNSPLHKFSNESNIETFFIDKNVGGRFSVFSEVGLIPLSVIGVDIDSLLKGCRDVHESFFKKEYYYNLIINKARFLVENKWRFNNNIVFSYSSVFSEFNKWYVQLWAESLGKINKNGTRQGLTPISLIGPDDQHSFLQLIIDGVRDKTVTFLKIDTLEENPITISGDEKFKSFDLDFIDGKSFNYMINCQADSTYQAIINQKDIPCDIITISSINEENIAKLMYRFQLLVSCVGSFLQINTYDQPGVESGKCILRSRLQND